MIECAVPSSKSLTQRALFIASLARGTSEILNPLVCDDSEHLSRALEQLGVRIERHHDCWCVSPGDRLQPPSGELFLGNAGTAVRFLLSLNALTDFTMTLNGSPAMRKRSHAGLFQALRDLGIRMTEGGASGHLPITLQGPAGDVSSVSVRGDESSQFLSGLLMVSPRLPQGLRITVTGKLVSRPYVQLTLDMMERFGVRVENPSEEEFHIAPMSYQGRSIEIEGDASGAAFMLAAGTLVQRPVRITNLPPTSKQGDCAFEQFLTLLNTPDDVTLDLGDTPDLVPPIVAVALFRTGTTRLIGIHHLRNKESDRIAVLSGQLSRLGARIATTEDSMTIQHAPLHGGVSLDPDEDHRMAMAFAVVGLRVPGVEISDRSCVRKSFPNFFELLEKFR